MSVYLFFKKYFVSMGRGLAVFLAKKGVTANQASIGSVLIIIPMFFVIEKVVSPGGIFVWCMITAIFIKLILNAIDGIIARERNESSMLGMVLNVWSDILPDIYIVWVFFEKYNLSSGVFLPLMSVMIGYFFLELLYITLWKTQNLFFGKDLRTLFYFFLIASIVASWSTIMLLYIYISFTLIHAIGFFLPKSRT